jgi:hypothetical protein
MELLNLKVLLLFVIFVASFVGFIPLFNVKVRPCSAPSLVLVLLSHVLRVVAGFRKIPLKFKRLQRRYQTILTPSPIGRCREVGASFYQFSRV